MVVQHPCPYGQNTCFEYEILASTLLLFHCSSRIIQRSRRWPAIKMGEHVRLAELKLGLLL